MIPTEQVPDFVCKHMSEKPSRRNAELLSTFYDPEVKHVDRAGSSIFVAGGRRRSQVFNPCLHSLYHFWCQNVQYKGIRAPVCGTPSPSLPPAESEYESEPLLARSRLMEGCMTYELR